MDTEDKKEEAPAKKVGLGFYVVLAIIVMVVLSFLVEIYGAFTEGRPINFELLNKLLDTMMVLLGPPPLEQ